MSIIRRIPNHEHMALCVAAAIRARWAAEATYTKVPANVVRLRVPAAPKVVPMRRVAK